jgi:RNA polymerase sigma-70 factor (ECF subfamily)
MPLGSGEIAPVVRSDEAANPPGVGAGLEFREFSQQLLRQLPSLHARARFLERGEPAADDLVQDTVERALRKSQRFVRGTDLRRWLLVIMQNLFTDRWRERSRKLSQTTVLPDVPALPESNVGAADAPARSELATLEDIRRALVALDEPLRTAFELRFFQRLSYQEVAARTGVPVATVGTRILRARLRVVNAVDGRDRRALCAAQA